MSSHLIHQNVCVTDIDLLKKKLIGYVELHFVPTKLKLARIRLNAKQCSITKLLARGSGSYVSCTFTFNDPLLEIVPQDPISIENEKTLKKFAANHQEAVYTTEADFGNGELIIQLPEEVQKDISDGSTFRILIEYILDNPVGGLHFVTPKSNDTTDVCPTSDLINTASNSPSNFSLHLNDVSAGNNQNGTKDRLNNKSPPQSPGKIEALSHAHVFTYKNHNNSRLWFPCIDSYNHPCTWILEYTVDSSLVAISCGDLINTTSNKGKKTFKYELNVPTAAPNIGFVVGNFESYSESNTSFMTYYYLDGLKKLAQASCSFMSDCHEYYEDLLNFKYPYPNYKQVFVDEAYEDCQDYATMSICNTNILHSKHIIDQTFITMTVLSEALAKQYFGCFIAMASWNSAWLTRGISSYVGAQYHKKIFGNNEYRFKVQDTMKKLIEYEQKYGSIILDNKSADIGKHHSNTFHFSTQSPSTVSPFYDEAHNHKSFLVMRMLEDRIGNLLLIQVLNKILSLASTASTQPASLNAWSNMLLSTSNFERAVFTVTGKDKEIASFLEHWIFRGGHAKFNGRFIFDRKRNVVELEIRQSDTTSIGIRPYFGPITITVQELDGTFAQKLNIEENKTTPFVITCHSKSRRNKKKKIPLCTGEEVDMDLSMMDNNDSPVLWIRIDPDMQLLRQVVFEQPDYQWQYQLKYERDVTAQLDALQILERYPTVVTRRILTEIIEDDKCYYRVRCASTLMLTKVANQMAITTTSGGWQAPTSMISIYKKLFGSLSCPHIIRLNQFSATNLQSYFLQKTFPKALAGLRVPPHRICPPDVLKFLLDLFKYNDNSKNSFSDNYYKAALVEALAETITPVVVPLFSDSMQQTNIEQLSSETKCVTEEITRCLNLEKILPCYKYTITVACLKAVRQLQGKGHLPTNPQFFRAYTAYNVFSDVRCAAVTELVDVIKAEQSQDDLIFLLDLVEHDKVPAFKFFILSELHRDPPMIQNFTNSKLVFDQLWKLINSTFAHDSKLRCATADLFQKLFDRPDRHFINVGCAGEGYKVKKKKKKDKKSREERKDKEKKKKLKKLRKLKASQITVLHPQAL